MADEQMRGAYLLAEGYRTDAVIGAAMRDRMPSGPERDARSADVARWARYADEHAARAAELELTTDNRAARPVRPAPSPSPSDELRSAWRDLERARAAAVAQDTVETRGRRDNLHQRVNLLEALEGRSDTELGTHERNHPLAVAELARIMRRG